MNQLYIYTKTTVFEIILIILSVYVGSAPDVTSLLTPDNLTAYNRELKENALTLAFKMRSKTLPVLVTAIKALDDRSRWDIINQCNHKNLGLISSSQITASLFKDASIAQRRDLYLLELERIILSLPDAPVRTKLNDLLDRLNVIKDLQNETSGYQWIQTIESVRKEPDVTQVAKKTGLLNWFKSAINFVIAIQPKGYGVGFFKPSVNTLLDDMAALPVAQQKPPEK